LFFGIAYIEVQVSGFLLHLHPMPNLFFLVYHEAGIICIVQNTYDGIPKNKFGVGYKHKRKPKRIPQLDKERTFNIFFLVPSPFSPCYHCMQKSNIPVNIALNVSSRLCQRVPHYSSASFHKECLIYFHPFPT
jgi:hypothetical protein